MIDLCTTEIRTAEASPREDERMGGETGREVEDREKRGDKGRGGPSRRKGDSIPREKGDSIPQELFRIQTEIASIHLPVFLSDYSTHS